MEKAILLSVLCFSFVFDAKSSQDVRVHHQPQAVLPVVWLNPPAPTLGDNIFNVVGATLCTAAQLPIATMGLLTVSAGVKQLCNGQYVSAAALVGTAAILGGLYGELGRFRSFCLHRLPNGAWLDASKDLQFMALAFSSGAIVGMALKIAKNPVNS